MAQISSDLKRLFLRGIMWDVQAAGQTLLSGLIAVARAKASEIKDGRVIQSSGLGGASVSYSFPVGMSPVQAAALASEMMDRYETAIDSLPEAPAPTDEQIFSAMMARLKPVRGVIRPDFTTLRI